MAVIWRSTIVAAYVALAVVVGVSSGARGLLTLLFFYVCAGAWGLFFLLWGAFARGWSRRRFRSG